MVCFRPFESPDVWLVGDLDLEEAVSQYQSYNFSHLLENTDIGVRCFSCDGVRKYTPAERIGRAFAGALLTLLTGFMGLLSPQIRSLFHAEHSLKIVWVENESSAGKISIASGRLSFNRAEQTVGGEAGDFETASSVGEGDMDVEWGGNVSDLLTYK